MRKAPQDIHERAKRNGHSAELEDAAMGNGHQVEGYAYHLTDLGNAQRLVTKHGEDLRFCHPWGKWLVWNGTRWRVDDNAEVRRRAIDTVAGIYEEASSANSVDERKDIAKHAAQSEGRGRIDNMLSLASALPGIPALPDQLDSDPWLLNCQNGTIDLRSGELCEHRREDLITKAAPVEYDPDATAPTFERFLERILPSEAVRDFLQRAVGYASTGVTTEEVLPILHGSGANGKTTLTGVVMDALGDYAIQAIPDLLMVKRGAHPTELTDLFGARFVVCMETEDGRRLAESLVKTITGRERIRARRMREDFWEFAPTHTVFLGTNHRPEVRGTDHAIWRRLKLVPFDIAIPDAEQDKKLPEKLKAELPGVLAWIVRGCLDYQRDGLGQPEEVTAATAGYRSEMDTLAAFFEERCVVHEAAEATAAALYNAYKEWCEENGETSVPQRRFGQQLNERGFQPFRYTRGTNKGRKGWYGVGLAADGGNEPPTGGDGEPYAAKGSPAQSGVDKPDWAKQPNQSERSEPESDINSLNSPRGGLMPEKGSLGSLGSLNQWSRVDEDNELFYRFRDAGASEEEALAEVGNYRRVVAEGKKPRFVEEDIIEKLRKRSSEES